MSSFDARGLPTHEFEPHPDPAFGSVFVGGGCGHRNPDKHGQVCGFPRVLHPQPIRRDR